MSFVINTNIPSISAQMNLEKTNTSLNNSIMKLSSGRRINIASDDPAGLGISNKLRSQITGLKQSRRNAEDGISAIQVAEGALSEIGEILIRMRELSVQASNGTLTSTDRSYLNTEVTQLVSEINRISQSTNFNGINLLSGAFSTSGIVLQIGLDKASKDMMTITISNMGSSGLGSTVMMSQVTISQSAGRARDMLKYIDAAINDVNTQRAQLGANLSRLQKSINNLGTNVQNLSSANSRILDVDVANETAELTKYQILMQAGVSVLSQANASPQSALALIG